MQQHDNSHSRPALGPCNVDFGQLVAERFGVLPEVAKRLGMSYTAVWARAHTPGTRLIVFLDGSVEIKTPKRAPRRRMRQRRLFGMQQQRGRTTQSRCRLEYGMTIEERNLLSVGPDGSYTKSPLGRFKSQRTKAHGRGIEWELTFSDWWEIWDQSGKWALRGNRKHQYCMARTGDVGLYARGNVRICTVAENMREAAEVRSKAA